MDKLDNMDKLLYKLAKKEYTPVPDEIHNNFMKTLHRLETERQNNIANKFKSANSNTANSRKDTASKR